MWFGRLFFVKEVGAVFLIQFAECAGEVIVGLEKVFAHDVSEFAWLSHIRPSSMAAMSDSL